MPTAPRTRTARLARTLPFALALAIGAPAQADDADVAAVGKERFGSYCAACHGLDAKGDGPVAFVLKKTPPDLTVLAKNNGGDFPFNKVYDMIDGRDMAGAHGTREMPVWGGEWKDSSKLGGETELRGRLLEIIIYLRSIQQ
ncbi:MAG: c-type cytochrome [Gammaproteobacteria bacterium]|nr:c-type cytochrome [Gammaproteobacteria bacterium]MCP5199815.1 c-type cytochrome [Gammaproteobacteria bacterium]